MTTVPKTRPTEAHQWPYIGRWTIVRLMCHGHKSPHEIKTDPILLSAHYYSCSEQ